MPIRFRCAYCNQLLGIAHRKAGTVVRCPTCAGQVIVPSVDNDAAESPGDAPAPLVFERNDFEKLLDSGAVAPATAQQQAVLSSSDVPMPLGPTASAPPGAWGTHAEPPYDVEKLHPAPPNVVAAVPVPAPAGILISPRKATILAVVAILALALAFAGGLLLGYSLRHPGKERQALSCLPSPAGGAQEI